MMDNSLVHFSIIFCLRSLGEKVIFLTMCSIAIQILVPQCLGGRDIMSYLKANGMVRRPMKTNTKALIIFARSTVQICLAWVARHTWKNNKKS